MGNFLTAEVTIRGVRPALWHHFGPDAIPLEKEERTGVPGNDPQEWRKSVLMTSERQLFFEPTYVFGMLRDAARYTKKGKSSIQSAMSATLQVTDERVLVDRFLPLEPIPTDSSECVYIDVRSVRNPSTKARNVRYRVASSAGWSCTFHLLWDRTVVSRDQMKAVLEDAGTLVGIADARNIGFGRFTVERVEIGEL